ARACWVCVHGGARAIMRACRPEAPLMRVLHTADWHLADRLGRIDRTADLRRAVERVAALCEAEKADLLLVAGDLFSELAGPDHSCSPGRLAARATPSPRARAQVRPAPFPRAAPCAAPVGPRRAAPRRADARPAPPPPAPRPPLVPPP